MTDPLTDILCRCGLPRPESLARETILASGLGAFYSSTGSPQMTPNEPTSQLV
ncbi:hypothetical protein M2284_001519 [Rhodococcus sp. LBL1]|uniref:Uncharacterized protein n=1 Tax=Prescottella agglutinans TaxID=1644129 RepID=A0ABT6MHV9_9NOCA|nr:hypothetical protein [Prescottella agglutinans]MDH6283908.1 hypothetical protein [Prescottella agglutinans]MDH6677321.1 hypothetical protein [Rhodococcus sp. LBL1]MDH6682385.1 hypothetical protein [Rhodococcus sp. LBL2]